MYVFFANTDVLFPLTCPASKNFKINWFKIIIRRPIQGLPWWLSSKESACNEGIRDMGLILGLEKSPGGRHGNHSSILTWRILWTKKPGRLQSIVSQRVKYDLAHMHAGPFRCSEVSNLTLRLANHNLITFRINECERQPPLNKYTCGKICV